ncbi:MAG: TIGR04282 family arsenosugar biosynthesis glycosyltransferase [Planctomyces sp.]|nr:TIGR04282 family arsenosugar biosynthesis glycosyltransferase [Planctomyces sp.]
MSTLVVFARHPVVGAVKSRLAADIGAEAARDLYEAWVIDLLDRTAGLADQRVVAVTPDTGAAREFFQPRLRTRDELWSQPDGDLGDRLAAACDHAGTFGGPVVVIGTDSPNLPLAMLSQAFDELAKVDVVLSPAADGGYVLVGLRRPAPSLFRDIPWSTSTVCEASIDRTRALGLRLGLLPDWYDVDSVPDLRRLWIDLQGSAEAARPRRTWATLCELASQDRLRHWFA